MKIRKAEASDQSQLEPLMQEFYLINQARFISPELKPFEAEPDQAKGIREYTRDLLTDKKYLAYVAENDGRIIGYGAAQIKKREDYTLDKEGFIEDLYVAEDYRGQGVGKQLFEALAGS